MRAHVNLLLVFFVPLAVYLVLRRVQGTMRVWTFVLLLAAVLFGQFATSSELFATLTLFGGIGFLLALAFGGSLRPRVLRTMLWTGVAYVVAGLAMLPILLQAFQDVPPESVRPTTKNAIDLLGYLVPSRSARIGGESWTSVSNGFPGLAQDNTAYMSFALLAVVAVFAIWGWRSKTTWLLLAALAIPMVLSFGPVLYVGGDPTIWMPQALLGKVPLLQHALPERFPAYAWLALGVIVAVWLAGLGRNVAIFGYALVAFGMVLVSTDLSDAPGYHGEMSVPAFFTDGTYADFIEPGRPSSRSRPRSATTACGRPRPAWRSGSRARTRARSTSRPTPSGDRWRARRGRRSGPDRRHARPVPRRPRRHEGAHDRAGPERCRRSAPCDPRYRTADRRWGGSLGCAGRAVGHRRLTHQAGGPNRFVYDHAVVSLQADHRRESGRRPGSCSDAGSEAVRERCPRVDP